MALGKKHEVKVSLENYVHLIIGEKKIGKSTLVAQISKALYGTLDALLSISIGDEDGYSAINGLVYEAPQNWKEFVAIVDELVGQPDENNFRMISVDTIDELVDIGCKEVMRLSTIDTGKKCTSINDAYGGYGRGREKVETLIGDQITRLKRSKYAVYLIGHNKVKNQKEKLGDEYVVMTSNLASDYFNIFGYKADIICNIITEREIDKEDKTLQGTSRYMYFRNDGYVEAGSRFSELPSRVEYGASEYIEAVTTGIKKSVEKEMSDADIKKQAKKEITEKEQNAKQFANKEKETSLTQRIDDLKARYAVKDLSKEKKTAFSAKLKELGYTNFTDLHKNATADHINQLEQTLSDEE